jgi:hypothetical protein
MNHWLWVPSHHLSFFMYYNKLFCF